MCAMGDTKLASVIGPEPPDECFEQLGPNDEVPTCEWDGTEWMVVYDEPGMLDPGFADPGIPAWFGVLMALVLVAGIAMTVWRLSLARKMATESGLDPDRATAMTMLSEDGLEATYLASSLRGQVPPPAPGTPAAGTGRSVEARLLELQRLRDQGLVTYEEYETRRAAIIDSI